MFCIFAGMASVMINRKLHDFVKKLIKTPKKLHGLPSYENNQKYVIKTWDRSDVLASGLL